MHAIRSLETRPSTASEPEAEVHGPLRAVPVALFLVLAASSTGGQLSHAPGQGVECAGASSERVRVGSPPNPAVLHRGRSGAPLLGSLWQPVIEPFLPGAVLDFVWISGRKVMDMPTSIGTLLSGTTAPDLIYFTNPGVPFEIRVVDECSFLGARFSVQGGSIAPGPLLRLTNALDIRLGTYGPLRVVGCSLGCLDVGAGQPLACGTLDVAVNEEIRIHFDKGLDPTSLLPDAFRIVEQASGQAVVGSLALDPVDARTLVFRPELSFDALGNPLFALAHDAAYLLKLPGTDFDSGGPYLRDINGQRNQSSLQCTVVASQGIRDEVPGAPRAVVYVDVVTSYDPLTGLPDKITHGVPADGVNEVYRLSDITVVFDDIVNPATVVNPFTGLSNAIVVQSDADGQTQSSNDRLPVPGTYQLQIDMQNKCTLVTFQPQTDLPRATTIVVDLAATIVDLGANGLENWGAISFRVED